MAEPLKNVFSGTNWGVLSTFVTKVHPKFDEKSAKMAVFGTNWGEMSLKVRSKHIANVLHAHLPQNVEESFPLIAKIAKLSAENKGSSLLFLPLSDFVELYGLEHLELSMQTLEFTTVPCTAEFAIRPFIDKYPIETIKPYLIKWAKSDNVHLRRLASEGTRPLLPWGTKLHALAQDPTPILPILEMLKDDPEKYVQKSVANHLNDISKNQPEIALQLAKKWQGNSQPADWIIKHGMRTLLKEGNLDALSLFNLNTDIYIDILNLNINNKTIHLDEDLVFHFDAELKNKDEKRASEKTAVRFEYTLTFMGKTNPSKPKKFQIKTLEMIAETPYPIRCKYTFRHKTTRTHYSGKHMVDIFANGRIVKSFSINLQV